MTSSTSTFQPQTQSTLLMLPIEIRLQIYNYALPEEDLVNLIHERPYTNRKSSPLRNNYCWHPPALPTACRQTRIEASSIYYTNNRFAIIDEENWHSRLSAWLTTLERTDVTNIRIIRIIEDRDQPIAATIAKLELAFDMMSKAGLSFSTERVFAGVCVKIRSAFKGYWNAHNAIDGTMGWMNLAQLKTAKITSNAVWVEDFEAWSDDLIVEFERFHWWE